MRRRALSRQQTRIEQTLESRSKLGFGLTRHRREQRMGEFAADCRPDLDDLFGGAKAIQPRH